MQRLPVRARYGVSDALNYSTGPGLRGGSLSSPPPERHSFAITKSRTHIMRPYNPKNAESMNASPRIGPAVPAKKNLIPSERYKLIKPGFACDVEAVGFDVCAGDEERAEGVGEGVRRVEEVCLMGEATAGKGGGAPVAPRGVGGGGKGKDGDGNGGMEDLPTRGEEVDAGLDEGGEPWEDGCVWRRTFRTCVSAYISASS